MNWKVYLRHLQEQFEYDRLSPSTNNQIEKNDVELRRENDMPME